MPNQVKADCDRCFNRRRAVTRVSFSLNGVEYRINLCDEHADALYRDFAGWSRLAEEVEPEQPFYTRDQAREIARKAVDDAPRSRPTPVTPERRLTAIPATARNWTLSNHAEVQLANRGPEYSFGLREVLLAAVAPTHVYDMETDSDRRRHVRGPVSLVVNPTQQRVITVMPNSQRWGNDVTPDKETADAR